MSTRKWLVVASMTAALTGVAGCSTGTSDEAGSSSAPDDAAVSSDAGAGEEGGTAGGADLSDVPDPVAEVNGQEITKDEFTQAFEAQAAQAQMSGQPVDQEQLSTATLDTLVDGTLLEQAAEEGGHEASEDEVDTLLEELATSNGLGSTEEFISALDAQGMDEETVREEVGLQVAIEKLIAEQADVEEPTDEEVRAYYDEIVAQQEAAAPEGEDGAAATGSPEQPAIPAFEEVEEQISQQLQSENENAAANALVEQLREDAEIVSNL